MMLTVFLWCSLYALQLLAFQATLTVGDSDLCCYVPCYTCDVCGNAVTSLCLLILDMSKMLRSWGKKVTPLENHVQIPPRLEISGQQARENLSALELEFVKCPSGLTLTWWGCHALCLTQTNRACPLLFILFLRLFLSLWPFQLYFIP